MSQQDSRELTITYFIFYKKTIKKLVLAAISFSWGDVITTTQPTKSTIPPEARAACGAAK